MNPILMKCAYPKGTVSRGFWLQVFFMDHLPWSPDYLISPILNILKILLKIRSSTSPVSTTLLASSPSVSMIIPVNLPPVSTTPIQIFFFKFEMAQGLGGKWFMKNLKSKISWHCPFKWNEYMHQTIKVKKLHAGVAKSSSIFFSGKNWRKF